MKNEQNEMIEDIKEMNDIMIGREDKMVELRKEINEMLKKEGKKAKY